MVASVSSSFLYPQHKHYLSLYKCFDINQILNIIDSSYNFLNMEIYLETVIL